MSLHRPTNAAAADLHGIISLLRLILAFFTITSFMWFGGVVFAGLNFQDVARNFLEQHPTLKIIPFPQFYAVLLRTESWRYCIAPLAAMVTIFFGAAFFVKDVFVLTRLRDAFHYIISSMFALFFVRVTVAAGLARYVKGKPNLLNDVGGPGWCTIQPGNVVMFRRLRAPSNITLGETYFLEPFEKIGQIANLDDQHDDRTDISAITRDGIRITIKDIHFRYRIFPEIIHGQPIRRSPSDPYPFANAALSRMTYNLVVEENGPESWRRAVGRAIIGGITNYVNEHMLDYLTAPRENQQDPRVEIRNSLLFGRTRGSLRELGAELLWVDIGHFAIDDEIVDETRQNLWAADWLGDAHVTRELGLAKRQAYQELGRAEAQAEIIVAISDALNIASNSIDPATNMRKILLVRAAQLMDAYHIESRKALEEKKP
jgi:hypothetical protein